MSGPQLFTPSHRASRPLSAWLTDHVLRPLVHDLQALTSVAEVDAFVVELDHRIRTQLPEPLELRGNLRGPTIRGGPDRPGPTVGRQYQTQLWLFEVDITGTLDLLNCWPDNPPTSLEPVGRRLEDEPTPAERRAQTLPDPRPEDPHPAFAEFTRDTFLLMPAPDRSGRAPGERHLYITIDTTEQERRVHRETGAFATAVQARVSYLVSMCAAINEQVGAYEQKLRADLREFARSSRARLDDSETLLQSLNLPAWAPPVLAPTGDHPETRDDSGDGDGDDDGRPATATPADDDGTTSPSEMTSPEPRTPATAPGPVELHAAVGQRLSSASFEDVQRIIAGWAQGVQTYPQTFQKLWEDELSCLLAATLKATTPGADHQVYRYGGKTDIVIRANDLPDGSSHEEVFVCEAKKGGPDKAAGALQDQLLDRYTTAEDTAAVLLLYLTRKDFTRARREALKSLRRVEGYVPNAAREADPTIKNWPVLTYAHRGRLIRVCVATVNVSYNAPAPKPKKRPARRPTPPRATQVSQA